MSENNILKEYRCYINKKLLCKASGHWQIEIMNSSNRIINYTWPNRKSQDEGPKWVDFVRFSVDLNCHKCWRLLWRAVGTDLQVEIKCQYCSHISLFSLEAMQSKRFATFPKEQLTAMFKNFDIYTN